MSDKEKKYYKKEDGTLVEITEKLMILATSKKLEFLRKKGTNDTLVMYLGNIVAHTFENIFDKSFQVFRCNNEYIDSDKHICKDKHEALKLIQSWVGLDTRN